MDGFEEIMKLVSTEPRYFKMDGTPYEGTLDEVLFQWGRDFEDLRARTVSRTFTWWGAEVSTVWLGMNYRFGFGPPLIFETVVFWPGRRWRSADMDRYSTKEEAVVGHNAMHRKWSNPFHVIAELIRSALPYRWRW